jgi:small-conductance mechanosensitive channel
MDFGIAVIGWVMMLLSIDIYRSRESVIRPLSIQRLVQILLLLGSAVFFEVTKKIMDDQLLTKVMFILCGVVCLLIAKDYNRKEESIIPFFSVTNLLQCVLLFVGMFLVVRFTH